MNYPACGKRLAERTESALTVNICDTGCGGVWFDSFELEKVDEAHESAGERLLQIGPHAPVAVDHTARRRCPKCADQVMLRNFFFGSPRARNRRVSEVRRGLAGHGRIGGHPHDVQDGSRAEASGRQVLQRLVRQGVG